MKRLFGILSIFALLACASSCGKGSGSCGEEGGVAAVVNGEPIMMEELNRAAKDRLALIDTEIYQAKKTVLDSLVEEKLIAEAAKKKGLSVDKYMEEEIGAVVSQPTNEEVRALYDARKGAISQPFDEVKGQIAEYLRQNRMAQARAALLAKLETDSKVEIKLSPPRTEVEVGDVPAIGDDGAKVTVIEFSDYQCPFCKRVRPTIWRIIDEYKGDVRYVFMDFPLNFHRDAKKAHEAARCAGEQGKYYEYNRKLFDNQAKLKVDDLKKYAKQLNLNMDEFSECLDSGRQGPTVDGMIANGVGLGVSGTPAFFINGIMLSGARPYESFKEIIDMELER
jgi:protein-disulfide isomerase